MFGVTTSDDYRPVAWMGRYPVDVTTMLVGVHVACCDSRVHSWLQFAAGLAHSIILHSIVHAIWTAAQVWRLCTYAFVHFPSSDCFGLLSRCTCCLSSGEKWNVFWADAPTSRSTCFVAGHAGSAPDAVGTMGTVRNCWFDSVTLWNFCCVCDHLSACRIVAADPSEVGRANSGCHLHASTTCLSRLERTGRVWTSIGVAFLFVELNGAGPELAWWDTVKARFASKPKYHVLPKPRARTGGSRSDAEDVYTSIDPILDKISKFGIGSLTASERRQLDRERERLLKNSEYLAVALWATQRRAFEASGSRFAQRSGYSFSSRASIISHST